MSGENVFENKGTGFSSLEISQEPDVNEDQLRYWDFKCIETFWQFLKY